MFKRVAILLFCLLIVFIATFGFAVGVVSVPTIFTYAADEQNVPEGYTQVSSNNQLGDAFLAYCKSRDSEITSSVIGASTTAAYNSLAKFCNLSGFNIADLQSHLWYLNESNKPTRWFFDSTGINIYNQAFAYLIQENGLEVGDEADIELYDGKYYDDSLIFVINKFTTKGTNYYGVNAANTLQLGSAYGISTSDITSVYPNAVSYSGSFGGKAFDLNVLESNSGAIYYGYSNGRVTIDGASYQEKIINGYNKPNESQWRGYFCLIYCSNSVTGYGDAGYYVGIYTYNSNGFRSLSAHKTPLTTVEDSAVSDVTINFTTNNNVINNNTYEGDTIINNYGDIITDPDEPDPDEPDPDDPYEVPYNPYPDNPNYDPNDPGSNPGTVTPPINPIDPDGSDNVNIDFPDFDLNLPEINWSLGDLSQKFPFSIPFDMVSLVRVLDAPAEAPRFEGTVNFGFTTWDYDINLDSFSSVAAVCRIVETLLFVFGLILITRNLIKG